MALAPATPQERIALIARLHLMLILAGIGFAAWNLGEGLARSGLIGGAGYLASGIGFGLFLVAAIVSMGMTLQGLKREMFDIRTDPLFRRARAIALYPAFAAAALAALILAYAGQDTDGASHLVRAGAGVAIGVFLIGWGVAGRALAAKP